MTIASRAYLEYRMADTKDRLEFAIMTAAKSHNRTLELPNLFCHNEFVSQITDWLKSEGLKVEYKETQLPCTGLGSGLCEDGELMTVSSYVISW